MNIGGCFARRHSLSLGDVAAGFAAQSVCEGKVVTISRTINFLVASKSTTRLIARGTTVKAARTTAFVAMEIVDDADRNIAVEQFVMHVS